MGEWNRHKLCLPAASYAIEASVYIQTCASHRSVSVLICLLVKYETICILFKFKTVLPDEAGYRLDLILIVEKTLQISFK